MADEMIETPGEKPSLAGMAVALEGLIKPETMQALSNVEAGKHATPAANNAAPAAGTENQEQPQGGDGNAAASTDNQENTEDKAKPGEKKDDQAQGGNQAGDKKSVFGINKKTSKPADLVIDTPEQLIEAVNKTFGQDLKTLQDMPKFFESMSKTRANAQKFEESQKEVEKYKNLLESLPQDFLDGMQAYMSGEDYTKVFTDKPKFDFNKAADKQDIKELVNHYFPGKFTDDDFTEETKSAALEIAMTAAKDKFNVEKQTKDGQRVATEAGAKQRLDNYKKSLSDSVEHLKKSFPDMEDVDLQEAAHALEGGMQGVVGMFFNQDGTVKQEAAEMLMWAKHGKSELQRAMEAASHITETRINEEMVSKGADRPNPTRQQQGAPATISDDTKKLIADLQTFKKSNKY